MALYISKNLVYPPYTSTAIASGAKFLSVGRCETTNAPCVFFLEDEEESKRMTNFKLIPTYEHVRDTGYAQVFLGTLAPLQPGLSHLHIFMGDI